MPLDLSIDREKEERFLEELRRIVLDLLNGKDCKVFLFGSRARGDYRRSSDADIAVEGLSEEEFKRFKRSLDELVEESFIPFTVDVVDLSRASDSLKEVVLKEGIEWK
ncbi:nucleotidyltransferase family protein [Phorcysia thermohydrogeniphila]|uniref:Polymerase beta nucleotidyltransferase domain-containing protein n=1 Tax=Phorcysia thermohydrogeniphila TaxID=936138 RepID=A0A4R1GB89_9BACT|nr:nucleotidyltransferase domain-containing protein [Phorcysia thermohydrogeniphila]TCK02909.1 hypothetical protein CLV27_1623 [Phorcysia thermohydrogeniphila]